jgi:hypothetical protein
VCTVCNSDLVSARLPALPVLPVFPVLVIFTSLPHPPEYAAHPIADQLSPEGKCLE